MNTEAPKLLADEHIDEILAACSLLEWYGLPAHNARQALQERLEDQARVPSDEDRTWRRTPAMDLGEHLKLSPVNKDERPILSTYLVEGRAYSLSPGQRSYIRDTLDMTPARWVKVVEVAMYRGEPDLIKRVTLVSEEHVANDRRHVVKRFAIDRWGHFMSDSKRRDEERKNGGADMVSEKATKQPKKVIDLMAVMEEYGV